MKILPSSWFVEEKPSAEEVEFDVDPTAENSLKFAPSLPPFGSMQSYIARWTVILLLIVFYSPTAFFVSKLAHGDTLTGSLGLAVTLPLSSFFLWQIHRYGVLRLALSVPMFLLATVIFGFVR